jgi:hypothetical protein
MKNQKKMSAFQLMDSNYYLDNFGHKLHFGFTCSATF